MGKGFVLGFFFGRGAFSCSVFSLFGGKRVHDVHAHKERVAFLCYLVSTTRCLRGRRPLTITYSVVVSRVHLLQSANFFTTIEIGMDSRDEHAELVRTREGIRERTTYPRIPEGQEIESEDPRSEDEQNSSDGKMFGTA